MKQDKKHLEVMKMVNKVLILCLVLFSFVSFVSADLCVGGATDPNCWSTDDITAGYTIWSTEYVNTGAISDTDGKDNSDHIMASHANTNPWATNNYPAIAACDQYTGDGHSDWYLPSKQQLTDAYGVVSGFQSDSYWSSTEDSAYPEYDAWFFYMFGGGADYGIKDVPYTLVRCLRDPPVCPGGMLGEGNSSDPCQITNWTQLNSIRGDYLAAGKYYKLMNNLSSTDSDYESIAGTTANEGAGWEPIGDNVNPFEGSFDGNSKLIGSIYINRLSEDYVGLFGYLRGTVSYPSYIYGNVSNLGLINANVSANNFVGGITGYLHGGSILNSFSTGNIMAVNNMAGGIVGRNEYSSIVNSYSRCNVSASYGAGGISGDFSYGELNYSYATGFVGGVYLGGISPSSCTSVYSYWDINASGQLTSGCGEGKTTSEMKASSTFTGWDWGIWSMRNSSINNEYPYLAWQDTDITECRNLTGTGLTYNLLNNISAGEGNDCLIIQADGITINGNGFSVTGNVNASRSGIEINGDGYSAYNNLVLKNISANGDLFSVGDNGMGGGGQNGGNGGSINISNSNITGSVTSAGGNSYDTGGNGGLITITNSTTGSVISAGGQGDTNDDYSGNGGNGGVITISSNSNISGLVTSQGGSGATDGGAGGAITVNNSNVTGTITSQGGTGDTDNDENGNGGNGGAVFISNSTTGSISSTGSAGSMINDDFGGSGGAITISGSNITGLVFSIGSRGYAGGSGGAITIYGGSKISGAILSEGAEGGTAGNSGPGGTIVIVNSTTETVSSNGAYAGNGGNITVSDYSNVVDINSNAGGNGCFPNENPIGGTIIINNSNAGIINTKGGMCDTGGVGGSVYVYNSNVISINSTGGTGFITGGAGGTIIISNNSNISSLVTSSGGNGGFGCYSGECFGGSAGNLTLINSRVSTSSVISLIGGSGPQGNGANGILSLNNSGFYNEYGMIKFFNVTTQETAISSILNIANNSVYVDSVNYPDYNKSANISFYNLAIRNNPYIKGSNDSASGICTNCYNFTALNLANVTFNVTSWTPYTNYSLKDRIAFLNLTYSPNTTDGIDPGINVTVNLTVPESPDFSISDVLLQLFNGTEWVNYTSDNLTNGSYGIVFPLAETEIGYNYTFNVWANNSEESNQSSNTTFNATWDCSFSILDSYNGMDGSYTDGDLGTVGGYAQEKSLGNIILNNTGDANYSDGCVIKFARTSSGENWYTLDSYLLNFSEDYYTLQPDQFPGDTVPGGLRYYVDSVSVDNVILGPKENATVDVKGIFPDIQDVLNEYPYFSIFANVTDTIDQETNKTVKAKMVVTSGAYLESQITTPTVSSLTIPLVVGNYSFVAYVRDVVSGADGANNTAYNVSFNWTLTEDVLNRSVYTSLTFFNETLNDTSLQYLNFTLRLNETNLVSMSSSPQMIYTYARGYEKSTGDLLPISQGIVSNPLSLIFECVNASDGICVSSCRTSFFRGIYFNSSDSDCGYCGDGISGNSPNEVCSNCPEDVGECPISTSSGGGGGGGGAGGGSFARSEANFELVRGENVEFELTLENKLSNPKNNISIIVKGKNSEYVIPSPSVLSYLGANSKQNVKFVIDAPAYFSSGEYLLQIVFEGVIQGNTSTSFTEVKYVTLTILEMKRDIAEKYINDSLAIISKMNSSGLILDSAKSILDSMNSNYENLNFNLVKDEAAKIEEIYNAANEYSKLKEELLQSMAESEKNGVSTAETRKILLLSEILFNRGDYVAAYEKLKEAKTSYLLETKGEFKLFYAIKNNPGVAFGIFFSLSLVSLGSGLLVKLRLLKRKLKMLAEEDLLLLELMKVIQRDCFEYNKLSMEEYNEAMYQYETRLSSVIQEKIQLESQIANLMKLQGRKISLRQEKDRLLILLRQTQEDYLNRGKIDTRVYENMLKTYSSRMNKVEEELVFIEAQEQIREISGFWARVLRFVRLRK